MTKRLSILLPLFALLLFVAAGCAPKAVKCDSPEDNPKHHYLSGMNLLEKGKIDDANEKFKRAVYCEDGYGPGYAGMAMVSSLRAKEAKEGYRQVDIDKAKENLKLAFKNASVLEDEFQAYVASIRVHTTLKTKNWLDQAENDYKDAMKLKVDENKLLYYEGREAAHYFMGLAFLEGREFQKARDRFSDVLGSKREGKWHEPADKGWKRVDKIVRALAGITVGDVGKEIALKDSVKKGDMVALLVDELKLDKLFAGRIPVKSQVDKMKPDFIPADVVNHQFKEEVITAMKWGVRGIEPEYDPTTKANLFMPDKPVTRKEMALVFEDVLIKLTLDDKIATAFFGHDKSPFPDVAATAAWYNAVMNMTTRNIMEAELSGEFRPNDNVDGAEAILAIRMLAQRINIH
ncbi:S-layer homology domain-containing protein [bacterium]|nr:MAG: S-layer homology domain-containing protein [bacterium]